jgi:uncharacterized protein YfdQ (DUF2303 family)
VDQDMTVKRKTYNITEDRQIRLERLAIDISSKTGKTVKWSELVTYLIDNYQKEAAEDMKSALIKEKQKNGE